MHCAVLHYLCRKRRLFAQQDLEQLLGQEGLDSKKSHSVFKLDVFDNTDYESRLPAEWVPNIPSAGLLQWHPHAYPGLPDACVWGPAHVLVAWHLSMVPDSWECMPMHSHPAGVPPTPAKVGKFDAEGNCTWHECLVVDCNEEANTYAVVEPPSSHDSPDTEPAASVPYWVARVNLCFAAEDPFVFARRHAEAHAARAKAEALLR